MVEPLWQLSVTSQHMVKSLTLNPYMSLCNLKLCTHIWSTNINFRPPPLTLDFLVRLGLNFHPGEFGGREGWGRSIGPPTFFVTDGQKRDYLTRASSQQRARGATKNTCSEYYPIRHYGCVCPSRLNTAVLHTKSQHSQPAFPFYRFTYLSRCSQTPLVRRVHATTSHRESAEHAPHVESTVSDEHLSCFRTPTTLKLAWWRIGRIPRHRHPRRHPRGDLREDVGVVEGGLYRTCD